MFCGVQPLLATNRSRWAVPSLKLSVVPWAAKTATGSLPPSHPLTHPGEPYGAMARNTSGREHASE
ncbi:hypothetical protein GCM10029992_35740 [Glycomyces albus]